MSRYVDAKGMKQTFCAECNHSIKCEDCDIEYHFKHFPTADVVEVVRCKDCDWFIINEIKADGTTDKRYKPTWCTYHNGYMNDDDFCSYGERRKYAEKTD